MKHRLSITVDEDTILSIQNTLRTNSRSGIFRNKSHFIEYVLKKFMEGDRKFLTPPKNSKNFSIGEK